MGHMHGDGAVNPIQCNRRYLTRATVLNLARSEHGPNLGAKGNDGLRRKLTQLPFQPGTISPDVCGWAREAKVSVLITVVM